MKKLFVLKRLLPLSLIFMASCTTYSVSVVHSEGVAEDMIDNNQTQTPSTDVSPDISIPASIIP